MTRLTLASMVALVFLVSACSSAQTPVATPNVEATVQASVQATMAVTQPTAQPAPIPTAVPWTQAPVIPTTAPIVQPTPEPKTFFVMHTDGQGVRLRKDPNGESMKVWPEMSIMAIVGVAQEAAGMAWSNVKDPDGNVGWVPTKYLDTPPPPTATPDRSLYKLDILALKGTTGDYGYAIVEGKVQNISGSSLKNVLAMVEWSDKNHKFITTDDALIDYDPLLPGQSSPFKIMTRDNPAMEYFTVTFRQMSGAALPALRSYKDK